MGTVEVKVTEAEGWLKGVMQQLTSRESQQELPAPAGFSGVLRPYQVRGFSWLAFMRRLGLGACLADDMGLGKTIQFIALMLHNASDRARRSERARQDSPGLPHVDSRQLEARGREVRALEEGHGPPRPRPPRGETASSEPPRRTTWSSRATPLMTRDVEALSAVDWDTVALDEAQNIKNHWTKQSQAAKRLKASQRIALTGTPIENRLSELWSIMDFLNPGYLGSLQEFRRGYAIPIERYGDIETQQRLRRIAQPFILRRLKTDPGVIDDLPEKFEAKVYCNLTDEQASLYDAYVKEMLAKIESCEGIERRGLVLAALTRLKQICDHPSLFLADNSSNLQGRSGKMERLREMLEEVVSTGEKALVFTQYAEMGEMLRRHLQASLGCETLFLHGGVPRKARDEMVLRFQERRCRQRGVASRIHTLAAGWRARPEPHAGQPRLPFRQVVEPRGGEPGDRQGAQDRADEKGPGPQADLGGDPRGQDRHDDRAQEGARGGHHRHRRGVADRAEHGGAQGRLHAEAGRMSGRGSMGMRLGR